MTELTDLDGTMHAAKMGAALGELYGAVLKGVKKARV